MSLVTGGELKSAAAAEVVAKNKVGSKNLIKFCLLTEKADNVFM